MSEDAEVTISYLILCHDSPDRIVRLVTRILSDDETGQVVIHFDKNSSRAKFNELKSRLHGISRCHILENRVRCGWGQWSLVEASLEMLALASNDLDTQYYYLLSEYCYPAKSLKYLKSFLFLHSSISFIENETSDWIVDGIKNDRYMYWHPFNKRISPLAHRWFYKVQKNLGIKQNKFNDFQVMFGSQWWCLNKELTKYVLNQRNVMRKLFITVWIPDECAIQTIVHHSYYKCISRSLTYSRFDSFGKPYVYNLNKVVPDEFFFYRKVI